MTELNARTIVWAAMKGTLTGATAVGLIVLAGFMLQRFGDDPHWVDLFAVPFSLIGAWMVFFHSKLVWQALKTIKRF